MGLVKKTESQKSKDSAKEKAAADAPEDPPVVKNLKEICDKVTDLERKFEKEVEALQNKYDQKKQPLFAERTKVLVGEGAVGTSALPNFWFTALKHHPAFEELIQDYDQPVFEHLKDIVVEQLDEADHLKGYKLTFKFGENPFFSNADLVKEYTTERAIHYNGSISATSIKATEIEWKDGKNVTIAMVKKKKSGGGAKKAKKNKDKEEPRPSFFRDFFRNLSPECKLPADARDQARMLAQMYSGGGDESDDEEDDDDEDLIDCLLEADLEAGNAIRENIHPWAVRWYTGEACPEGDDEDSEEEDLDEDEEEESEEESSAPAKGKAKAKKSGGGGKAGGKGDGKSQEECKQQ